MTTAMERGRVRDAGLATPDARDLPGGQRRPRASWFARDPAWPIVVLLAGWPLWWALGVADFAIVLMAIPMLWRMYQWRARRIRAIRFPPGFGLWLIFLAVMIVGVLMVSQQAPGTLPGPAGNRVISWAIRAAYYLGATVALLYAGNLTERELPRKRLAWLLGLLGIYTVVGGLLGVVLPHLHFSSPLALLVPQSVQNADPSLSAMLHPALTQTQTFKGLGRPEAPFNYSNGWGDNFAILLPWLVVGWRSFGSRRHRRIASIALVIALIPVVFSFDRGLWIGLVVSAVYMMARLTTLSLAKLSVFFSVLFMIGIVVVATPMLSLISTRLAHGSSDAGRESQSVIALNAAEQSPLLGYGDTRHQAGSAQSIAIGRTANCKDCGGVDIGSHGQLWLLLIANGFLGTFFYLAFFLQGAWRYRRDKTPYGLAGELVILLGFVFMFAYQAAGVALALTMLAYAVLWRNDMQRHDGLASGGTSGHGARGAGARRSITTGAPA